MRKKPSFKEFLFTDYFVLGPLLNGVLFIVIGLYFLIFEKNMLGFYGFGGVGLLIILLSFWRLIILNRLYTIGVEIKGKITNVSSIRRSYRVTLEYEYKNQHIKSVWTAVKNQKIRNLRNLEEVNIIANPNKVKQAIVMEAFKLNEH